MKDEGSPNRVDRQNNAHGPYLPAENKQQAPAQLDNDEDDIGNGWHRQSSRRDPGDRGSWTDNFAKAAHEKQHGHQTTADKCNGICTPRHKTPFIDKSDQFRSITSNDSKRADEESRLP